MAPAVHGKSQQQGKAGINRYRLGDSNRRLIFQIIRSRGAPTCAEIAAEAGLSHQAALSIVKRLGEDKLVVEGGRTAGQRGQPAAMMKVNPKGAYAVGLNIDRNHLVFVVTDLLGQVQYRAAVTKAHPLPADALAFLDEQISEVVSKKIAPKRRIIGIGIAIPNGISRVPSGLKPVGFEQWRTTDFAALCTEKYNLPAYLENDAAAAAFGEREIGDGREHASFMYVLVSAGLGCGLIINGQPYKRGKNPAGEIGNIPLQAPDQGMLSQVVSTHALLEELKAAGASETMLELEHPSAEVMAAVSRWADKAVHHMTLPLLTLNYAISPEIGYIGGALPRIAVELLCERLNDALRALQTIMPVTQFQPSTASTDASAVGAAVLVIRKELLPS